MKKKAGQRHRKNIRQPQKKTVEQTAGRSWQPVGGEEAEGLPVIRPLVAGIDLGTSNIGCVLPTSMAQDAKQPCSEPQRRSWKKWRGG
jgi:hypothetical protein